MMLLIVGFINCLGARLVCSYMTKHKLQTRLKLESENSNISSGISHKELPLNDENIINRFSGIHQEILFKTDCLGKWTCLSPIWSKIIGFTVLQSIRNNFLDCIHSNEYLHNLELLKVLKAEYIEETVYKTRNKTSKEDIYLVRSSMRSLVDNQGEMIGTSDTLKVDNNKNQSEHNASEQNKNNSHSKSCQNKNNVEVVGANNKTYLEALISIERLVQNLTDKKDKEAFYREVLSILGLTYKPGRIYICEYHTSENNHLLISQKSEWYDEAIISKINNFSLQGTIATDVFPNFVEQLLIGDIVWSNIDEASSEEKKFFEARGIVSILLLPIMVQGKCFGFIGLEDSKENRVWQSTEIAFLQATLGIISIACNNLLARKNLHETIKEYQSLNSELQKENDRLNIELYGAVEKNQVIQNKLEKYVSLQKITLETITDAILLVDGKGCIIGYNYKFLQMWGIPQSSMKFEDHRQILKSATHHLKEPEEYFSYLYQLDAYPGAEIYDWIEFKDGRTFERYSQAQYIDDEIVGRVWTFRDISERFQAEATIRHQASHDLLTNLPNRMQFHERLLESLIKASQNKRLLAVCFLDLDRFKTINETLGHQVGDKLLQSVAQRLKRCMHSSDIVARWGGDEFTLLLSEINDTQDAASIAEEILKALKPAFLIDNHLLHISASIGIAVYQKHGKDAETLIKNADAALNRAKLQGRNHYQIYNSAINSHASELLSLENSLHYAIERNELRLYYQPQVDISSKKICKFEALLRWQHPKYGLISPGKFIPIAEETGLIVPISEWVLRTACIQNKIWQSKMGLPPVRVAVNLSARQFQQPDLVKTIRRVLAETQLSHKYLELEITESAAMQNVDFSTEILTELYNMGVSISIDDFGTGYCSFNYLKEFPIHCLKIDRSFVQDLTKDTNDAAIITAMIALAHGLNLSVVAEGVETEEQRHLLKILECEMMQGNLFSPAVCAKEATELLLESKSRLINTSVLAA